MLSIVLFPVALLCGVLLTTQVGTNSILARALGNPFASAAVNMAVALALAAAILLLAPAPFPNREHLARAPWWAWPAGGALGIAYLTGNIVLAPRLGAATLTGLIVVGQLTWSVALDHLGWLGFEQHTAGLARLAGVALMAGGVLLVVRG